MLLYNCQFLDNFATQSTNGIFGILSIVWALSSTFETSESKINQLSPQTKGCYINALFGVALSTDRSSFSNGWANIGGAIYIGLKTIPYVYRTTFIDNFANKGGAIYSDSVQDC